jgi:hypothetical protein
MSDEQKLKCIFHVHTPEYDKEIERYKSIKVEPLVGKILQFQLPSNITSKRPDANYCFTLSPDLIREIEYRVKVGIAN